MKKRLFAASLAVLLLLAGCAQNAPTPSGSDSPAPSQSAEPTPTPAPSPSEEPEPSPTVTPTPAPVPLPTSGTLDEISVENLDPEAEAGVGLPLVYESNDTIIFWGIFGLFGYDLKQGKITFSVDFKKLYNNAETKPSVQGSFITIVRASTDGTKLAIYYGDPLYPELGELPCYINLTAGTWEFSAEAPAGDTYISFDSETRLGDLIPGGTIWTTTYIRGEKTWKIFQSDKTS